MSESHLDGTPDEGQRHGNGATLLQDLVPLLYNCLSEEAIRFTRQTDGHTSLDASSVVREALASADLPNSEDYGLRARIMVAASVALRRLLVETARECLQDLRRRSLRGGSARSHAPGAGRIRFDRQTIDTLLALDAALVALEELDASRSCVATSIIFGKLKPSEISAALDCPSSVVKQHWLFGRTWLHSRMNGTASPIPADETSS